MTLYKYLSSDRIDVLLNRKIRYTQFGALNDPLEVVMSFNTISSDRSFSDLTGKEFRELMENEFDKYPGLNEIVPKAKLLSLLGSMENELRPIFINYMNSIIGTLADKIKEQFDLLIGAFSLSEQNDHQLMWSHYAENHFGYVIGFNKEHEYFNQKLTEVDELRHLRKVKYKMGTEPIDLLNPNDVESFIVKHNSWSYEKEWRIMRPLKDADERVESSPYPIYLFSFPESAVIEIIFGCRMPINNKVIIKEILKSYLNNSQIVFKNAVLDKNSLAIKILNEN